jgi:uncharacterized membrane protein
MAENETEQQDSETAGENGQSDAGPSVLSRLLSKDVLIPAAATAATAAAAGYAAKKAPDVKNRLSGEAKEGAQTLGREGAEGAKEGLGGGNALGALASGASKLMPGKGKGGKKKTRRLPIQRWTDVAVPVEEAFEQWTNFEEFPKFMHRVVKVNQKEENTVEWEEKIWFSRRQWQGEITDLRENDRVAWKTVSGTMHSGIVSFHRLDDNLTRVLVTVDFQPSGMIEKMASGLRFAKRAVQADLARFKAYVELGEAEGLEYEAAPKKDEQDERESDVESDVEGSSRDGASANGESEAAREEREQRRKERREALSAK